MVLSGIVASATQVADWSTFYLVEDEEDIPLSVLVLFHSLELIASIGFYGFVLRFYSVQTQLKTENENTLVIMQKMAQAKSIEYIIIVLLAVDWGTDFFLVYNDAVQSTLEISDELYL